MPRVELKHITDENLKHDICNDDTNIEYFLEEEKKVNFEDEHEHPKRNFLLSSLSIDEKRISALIVGLIISLLFAGGNYIYTGDISNNLTSIITTLIYAIAGINITDSIVSKIKPNMSDADINLNTTNFNMNPGMNSNMVCPSEDKDTTTPKKKRIVLRKAK